VQASNVDADVDANVMNVDDGCVRDSNEEAWLADAWAYVAYDEWV